MLSSGIEKGMAKIETRKSKFENRNLKIETRKSKLAI